MVTGKGFLLRVSGQTLVERKRPQQDVGEAQVREMSLTTAVEEQVRAREGHESRAELAAAAITTLKVHLGKGSPGHELPRVNQVRGHSQARSQPSVRSIQQPPATCKNSGSLA